MGQEYGLSDEEILKQMQENTSLFAWEIIPESRISKL